MFQPPRKHIPTGILPIPFHSILARSITPPVQRTLPTKGNRVQTNGLRSAETATATCDDTLSHRIFTNRSSEIQWISRKNFLESLAFALHRSKEESPFFSREIFEEDFWRREIQFNFPSIVVGSIIAIRRVFGILENEGKILRLEKRLIRNN